MAMTGLERSRYSRNKRHPEWMEHPAFAIPLISLLGAGAIAGAVLHETVWEEKGSGEKSTPIKQPSTEHKLPENHVSKSVSLPNREEILEKMARIHK